MNKPIENRKFLRIAFASCVFFLIPLAQAYEVVDITHTIEKLKATVPAIKAGKDLILDLITLFQKTNAPVKIPNATLRSTATESVLDFQFNSKAPINDTLAQESFEVVAKDIITNPDGTETPRPLWNFMLDVNQIHRDCELKDSPDVDCVVAGSTAQHLTSPKKGSGHEGENPSGPIISVRNVQWFAPDADGVFRDADLLHTGGTHSDYFSLKVDGETFPARPVRDILAYSVVGHAEHGTRQAPEPGSISLFFAALIALGVARRAIRVQ